MRCTDYETPKVKRGIIKKALVALSAISIIVTVAADVFLPQIVDYYQDIIGRVLGYSYVIFMWISSVPLIVMLIHFLCISLDINKKSVFSQKVSRYIGRIQKCLLIEVLLYVYAVFNYRLLLTVVILFSVVILLLLATLFKEVIQDGKEYYTDSTLSV